MFKEHKENIQKQIRILEEELNSSSLLEDISEYINSLLSKEIKYIENTIDREEKELLDFKEESDSYQTRYKRLLSLKDKVSNLEKYFIK